MHQLNHICIQQDFKLMLNLPTYDFKLKMKLLIVLRFLVLNAVNNIRLCRASKTSYFVRYLKKR